MMLRDIAYSGVKECMYANRLKPGQFVTQRELAELVSVPLAPMREAIQRLAAESLIRIIPRRGIQIAELDIELVKDLFQHRVILEREAARLFVRGGDLAALDGIQSEMNEVVDAARDPIDEATARAFIEADWKLHYLIVESMENEVIARIHRGHGDIIRLMRHRRRFTQAHLLAVRGEHQAVVDALRAHDGERAAEMLEHHLLTSLRRGLGIA